MLTKTPYFCHRPQDTPFPSYLSFFCGRWGNDYVGLEGSGTRVSCGKPECSLWPHSMCPSPLAPPFCSISVCLLAENHRRLHADCILWPQMIWESMRCSVLYSHSNPVLLLPGLCVVLLVRQCLLPLRSLWRGPSLSWSPGYPGWSFPAGRGESLPQTGWSYVSRSFHLKQIWWFILCRCSGLHTNMWKQTALNKNGKKLNELLVI